VWYICPFPNQNIEGGIKTFSQKGDTKRSNTLACLLARSLPKRFIKTLQVMIDIKPSESSLQQKFVNSRQSREGKKGPGKRAATFWVAFLGTSKTIFGQIAISNPESCSKNVLLCRAQQERCRTDPPSASSVAFSNITLFLEGCRSQNQTKKPAGCEAK